MVRSKTFCLMQNRERWMTHIKWIILMQKCRTRKILMNGNLSIMPRTGVDWIFFYVKRTWKSSFFHKRQGLTNRFLKCGICFTEGSRVVEERLVLKSMATSLFTIRPRHETPATPTTSSWSFQCSSLKIFYLFE